MKMKSITVGGYKNLSKTRIVLDGIAAIISPNNYGKSNLLEAIDFGTDFLGSNPKERKQMMKWVRGIPINPKSARDEFFFEIEFEDDSLGEYRFVKYGYSFSWYRDDGSGQRITNEWLEMRPTESVRFSSYLKRSEGKYRKSKDTVSFRKIALEDGQLSIDVLSSVDDLEIVTVIRSILKFDYRVCSSLDLGDRYQPAPIEYIDENDPDAISFDDKDVPRAVYMLQKLYPEKYNLFLEAVFNLFPDFTNISVQSLEIKKENSQLNLFVADNTGKFAEIVDDGKEKALPEIPFKIKDEIYRIVISSTHLNQPINMAMMSTGTKRVFWLLANVFIASSKGLCMIGIEELETSIHPRLLKGLLEILDEVLENTCLLISSHSPYLVQYIKPEKLYVGEPNRDGMAHFGRIKGNKTRNLINTARDSGMAVGEYLFDLMAGDSDSAETLSFYLEG